MDEGRILMDGTPREVFSRVDDLRRVELDVPQPTELCAALKADGLPLPDGVLSVDECVEALSMLFDLRPSWRPPPHPYTLWTRTERLVSPGSVGG